MSLFWQEQQKKEKMLIPRAEFPDSQWVRPELPSDNWLSGVKNLAVDVETHDPQLTSKGPGVRRDGYIIGVAIGTDDGRRFYYPVRHDAGHTENYPPELIFKILKQDFGQFMGNVVGANLLYDLDYLAEEGVWFHNANRFYDVQVAEPLLNENRLSFKLDILSNDYLGLGKDEDMLEQAAAAYGFPSSKKHMKDIHPKYVGAYAEADVDRPLRIFPKQYEELTRQGLLKVFDMECRLIPLLLHMRRRGVRVDLDRAEQVRADIDQRLKQAQALLNRVAGQTVNVWANESIAHAFKKADIEFPVTAKGNPSFRQEWLDNHPSDIAQGIMTIRKLDKVIGTFIDGHILGHNINGRIHSQFHQLKSDGSGTVSGRFSSSNPNLQQIPSRDPEMGPLLRSMFIPEPGEVWECFDWSQIEYRLLAHYAMGDGAEDARRKYREDPDTDFHKACAEMAGIDPEDEIKRKKVKNVNFLSVYGGGVATAAKTMGVSIQEAEEFLDMYHKQLPFVKHTLHAVKSVADGRGYIKTIMGRRRRFNEWQPADWDISGQFIGTKEDAIAFVEEKQRAARMQGKKAPRNGVTRYKTYSALNSLLQGSAGDLMKLAMVQVWESGVCDTVGAPLLTVHDELDTSVPNTPAGKEASDEIKNIMETCLKLNVPVMVDRERGPNWGELEKG